MEKETGLSNPKSRPLIRFTALVVRSAWPSGMMK